MNNFSCVICDNNGQDITLVGMFDTRLCKNCINRWTKFVSYTPEYKKLVILENEFKYLLRQEQAIAHIRTTSDRIFELRITLFNIADKWLKDQKKNNL